LEDVIHGLQIADSSQRFGGQPAAVVLEPAYALTRGLELDELLRRHYFPGKASAFPPSLKHDLDIVSRCGHDQDVASCDAAADLLHAAEADESTSPLGMTPEELTELWVVFANLDLPFQNSGSRVTPLLYRLKRQTDFLRGIQRSHPRYHDKSLAEIARQWLPLFHAPGYLAQGYIPHVEDGAAAAPRLGTNLRNHIEECGRSWSYDDDDATKTSCSELSPAIAPIDPTQYLDLAGDQVLRLHDLTAANALFQDTASLSADKMATYRAEITSGLREAMPNIHPAPLGGLIAQHLGLQQ
jgi:hypothetical protein